MWNCLWGHALKRSPGINCKSRVLYPGPGFLSSATWPSMPKKHYNGLINQSISRSSNLCLEAVVDGVYKTRIFTQYMAPYGAVGVILFCK